MPYLTIHTNVNFTDGKKIAEDTAKLTSVVLGKPINYVATNILYNPNMSFAGSNSTLGALAELKSIGLGNKARYVSELTQYLQKALQIADASNINITLIDSPAAQTASGGRTFD